MAGSNQGLDAAFEDTQAHLHRSMTATSVVGSAVLGAVLVWALWGLADPSRLLAWAAAQAAILSVRLAIAAMHSRSAASHADDAAWLRRYRIGFAVHGLVWCLGGMLLLPGADPTQLVLLFMSFVAISAGSVLAASFDVTAAALFSAPALTPLLLNAFPFGQQPTLVVAVILILFATMALLGALRAQRSARETVRLQLAKAAQAEVARRHPEPTPEPAPEAKSALAEQHHLFSLLLRTTAQGYWFIDNAGLTLEVNAAMCTLLGRQREQVVGRSVFDFFADAEVRRLQEHLAACRRGEVGAYEVSLRRPDGSRVDCLNNATPVFDTAGKALGCVGLWTDVTALRRAEAALRTYEVVANSITDMVSVMGQDRVYRLVNDEWCRCTGVARADAIGRHAALVAPGLSTEERRQAMSECIALGQIRVVRAAADSPAMAGGHFETTYYPYTEPGTDTRFAVVVTRDVTEQESSRQQLAMAAEYLRRTLNATGDAIFATDAADQHEPVRFVNEQMLQLWGIAPERAATLTPADISARSGELLSDPAAEVRRVDAIVAANVPHEDHLHLVDGRVLLRRCIPARVGGRNLRVWSFRDITAEERALRLARSSEAEQRALLDAFPGLIARQNADLVYSYVNPPLAARLGLTPEQMVGKGVAEVLGPQRAAELRLLFDRALAGERVTYERVYADGGTDQVTLAVGFDPHDKVPTIYTFGIDITNLKRAEQQLRSASEQLGQKTRDLQLTLDSIAQGIVAVDADGRIGVYNRRTLELLGLPEALMTPQVSYDDIVRFQVQRGDLAGDASFVDADGRRRYFKGGRAASPEVYVRRNHTGALIEVRTRQIAGGGLVRTFTDVTAYVEAQLALKERQAELRAVLAAFPGAIMAVDQDTRYTYVNAVAAGILGLPPDQIVGAQVRDVLGEARFLLNAADLQRALRGEPAVSERSVSGNEDRPRIDLEITHVAGPLQPDGRRICYVFAQDITARKRAEEALIVARDEAERANRAKSTFLSHMSHELRTPMNAILGFGQLLASDAQHPLVTSQLSHVHEILRGARHLLDLINESLDLGRIEAGDLPMESVPVPVGDLIEECLSLMRPLAQAHHVRVQTADADGAGERVWADRTRLKQVLLNLLANAIKYNHPGGEVEVACRREGGRLHVAVHDSGPGLSADEQQRLFQPFERLSAARSDIEGTGIGLALSRYLVHAMGGEIGVESVPGQGSTFWIRMDRVTSVAMATGSPMPAVTALPTPSVHAVDRTVLYIEDNPVNVVLMEAMLARLPGVHTLVASLPQRGIEMARSELPDLVLLDIQLPGMNGFEVLEHLKADARTLAIPVIAVSANAMPADVDAGRAAGFVDYLTKPLDLERLLAAVRQALNAPGVPISH